jgi:hypothetical protein
MLKGNGPILTSFGVPGALVDPELVLYRASDGAEIARNDNWRSSLNNREAEVRQYHPGGGVPDNAEAILTSVMPQGGYTVHLVNRQAGTSRVGLLEVFEAPASGPAAPTPGKLLNVSGRGTVGRDGDILFGGIIVSGTGPRKILIRGVGPTLSKFGVTGALQDTILTLFNANGGILVENDDWKSRPEASYIIDRSQAVGAFALGSNQDSAMIVVLNPGSYTVQLKGKNNSTGIGLLEIYDISGN